MQALEVPEAERDAVQALERRLREREAELDAREAELDARQRNLPSEEVAQEAREEAVKRLTHELLTRNAREAIRSLTVAQEDITIPEEIPVAFGEALAFREALALLDSRCTCEDMSIAVKIGG